MRLAGAFIPFAVAGAPLNTLRKTITNATIDTEIAREIRAFMRELGVGKLAVRSSAVGEDSGLFSFAGLHDSVLGVEGEEDCFGAILRCWASLYSDRAVDYRNRNGIPLKDAAMAVIVQRLVPAQVSGVLFTADPSGLPGMMAIEAVAGTGDALVSGRAAPERWILGREDLAVSARPDPQAALLDNRRVRELADTGLKIEKAFGAPQDIEWAIAFGKIHILQARPITSRHAPTDRTIWSDTNTRELLPDPVSPMTWSLVSRGIIILLKPLLDRAGFDPRGLNLLGLVAGRVYFNMNALAAIFRIMPGTNRRNFSDFFGGDRPAVRTALAGIRDEDLPAFVVNRWKTLVRKPSLLLWVLRNSGIPAGFLAAIRLRTADEASVDIHALNDTALGDRARNLLAFDEIMPNGFTSLAVGPVAIELLARFCRRRFGDADRTMANRLLAAVGGLETAESGLALWRLADAGREQPVADVLASGGTFAKIRPELDKTVAGRAFLTRWDEFMAKHGHHARMELDLEIPRWREQPDYILSLVRTYLAVAATTASPVEIHASRAAEREEISRDCRRKLRNPALRFVFDILLDRAQRGVALRETAKSEIGRRLDLLRETILEAGQRLTNHGALHGVEDVFYLTLDELPAALTGAVDLRDAVAQRRAEREADIKLSPPAVVIGRFDPARHAAPDQAIPTDVLHGIPISPGLVEGRARVILHTDRETRLKAGEILVIPFADPGWTPYFLQAAAIIMDQGGTLSHGSIIAREYGIPTVVNVGPGTNIIRTGQQLRVNAYSGEVRLLKDR
jgi:pyruvate,water dikinase